MTISSGLGRNKLCTENLSIILFRKREHCRCARPRFVISKQSFVDIEFFLGSYHPVLKHVGQRRRCRKFVGRCRDTLPAHLGSSKHDWPGASLAAQTSRDWRSSLTLHRHLTVRRKTANRALAEYEADIELRVTSPPQAHL